MRNGDINGSNYSKSMVVFEENETSSQDSKSEAKSIIRRKKVTHTGSLLKEHNDTGSVDTEFMLSAISKSNNSISLTSTIEKSPNEV